MAARIFAPFLRLSPSHRAQLHGHSPLRQHRRPNVHQAHHMGHVNTPNLCALSAAVNASRQPAGSAFHVCVVLTSSPHSGKPARASRIRLPKGACITGTCAAVLVSSYHHTWNVLSDGSPLKSETVTAHSTPLSLYLSLSRPIVQHARAIVPHSCCWCLRDILTIDAGGRITILGACSAPSRTPRTCPRTMTTASDARAMTRMRSAA